jgi:hypothetical protein
MNNKMNNDDTFRHILSFLTLADLSLIRGLSTSHVCIVQKHVHYRDIQTLWKAFRTWRKIRRTRRNSWVGLSRNREEQPILLF